MKLTLQRLFVALVTSTSLAAWATPSPQPERIYTVNDHTKVYSYHLKNGLSVFITENKKAPTTSIYHWVKGGSLNETPGITGIAHLFEHMMFRPLKPGVEGFMIQAGKLGAMANANTRFESTVYTTVVPTPKLSQILKLESERFKNLTVTKELLDVERKAVWSEYSTKLDVNPVMDLWFQIYRNAYDGTPYGWHVVGYREDLEKITAEDCNKFFKANYAPNNVGLFISGDIKAAKIIEMVQADYGDWAQNQPKPVKVELKADTKFKMSEGKLKSNNKSMLIGFRTPTLDASNFELQTLAHFILNKSQFALAPNRLVDETKKALAVDEFNFDYDNGMIKSFVNLSPNESYQDAVEEYLKLREAFAKISDADFKAYVEEYKTSFKEALYRNDEFNQELAFHWGKYNSIDKALDTKELFAHVSKKDVIEFVNKYMVRDNTIAVINKQ